MLAKIDWGGLNAGDAKPPCDPLPDLDYSGYPEWIVLAAPPNREFRSAMMLQNLNISPYVPKFARRQRCGRGETHYRMRLVPVIPMLLFVPVEMLAVDDRDAILAWAGLRYLRNMRHMTKLEVEVLRQIEATLAVRRDQKTKTFDVGQSVRFANDLWAAYLGMGTVVAIASDRRICVKVSNALFGGHNTIWVPANELEVM